MKLPFLILWHVLFFQVITNGFFSFGVPNTDCCPELFSTSDLPTYRVAPFWEDIITTQGGKISYQVFSSAQTPDTLHQVSTFVSYQTNATFSGSWMLVAEWNAVPQFNGLSKLVSPVVFSRGFFRFIFRCIFFTNYRQTHSKEL